MMRQRPKVHLLELGGREEEDHHADHATWYRSARSKKRFGVGQLFPKTRVKKFGWPSLIAIVLSLLLKLQISVLWDVHQMVASPIDVTFRRADAALPSIRHQHLTPIKIPKRPDYGGLSIRSPQAAFQRHVLKDDEHMYHQERKRFLKKIDEGLDVSLYHNDELEYPQRCIRPNWVWNYYPVCSNFHELSVEESIGRSSHGSKTTTTDIRYLNHGASREAWLVEPVHRIERINSSNTIVPFVLKTMRTKYDYEARSLRRIHIEALILERLSASDRTTDIYGHCGSSIMVEYASDITELIVPDQDRPQISKRALAKLQKHDVHPMNNFTAEEKLELAIAMAEGIAELHGYKGGVIVNSDIHPEQWVRSKVDGKVKLNDFNNGFFLEWNAQENRSCGKYRSFGGDFHSPEEFQGDYVDEKIDVYSMGNNIHCLLTGLWQFPWLPNEHDVQPLVIAGKRDHVDPRYRTRSLIEGRLVEIMERAWIHDPEERASIFEVVRHLHETRRLHEQKKAVKQKR